MDRERLSSFGDRIRTERERQGLSQGELARKAGLSRTTVNRAERGVVGLNVINVHRIAEALGLTVADLFAVAS